MIHDTVCFIYLHCKCSCKDNLFFHFKTVGPQIACDLTIAIEMIRGSLNSAAGIRVFNPFDYQFSTEACLRAVFD